MARVTGDGRGVWIDHATTGGGSICGLQISPHGRSCFGGKPAARSDWDHGCHQVIRVDMASLSGPRMSDQVRRAEVWGHGLRTVWPTLLGYLWGCPKLSTGRGVHSQESGGLFLCARLMNGQNLSDALLSLHTVYSRWLSFGAWFTKDA